MLVLWSLCKMPWECCRESPLTLGLQIPEILPREAAIQVVVYCSPPDRLLWAVCCCKRLLQLVGQGQLSRSWERPLAMRDCTSWAWCGPSASPRWCTHTNCSRPTQSLIWPFGEAFNIEKIAPSFRLHMKQDSHRVKSSYPTNMCLKTHNSVFPYISGASRVAAPALKTM